MGLGRGRVRGEAKETGSRRRGVLGEQRTGQKEGQLAWARGR
ncbi:hypothetical protein [Streptomyces sp. NPDC005752]